MVRSAGAETQITVPELVEAIPDSLDAQQDAGMPILNHRCSMFHQEPAAKTSHDQCHPRAFLVKALRIYTKIQRNGRRYRDTSSRSLTPCTIIEAVHTLIQSRQGCSRQWTHLVR